ncbi:MAG: hypothetical protein K9H64_17640 [Bacteroidales bacterium]|nr:hypothetical protein [Bacteroidales bacterium]MCF8457802.1 hypothetical protein [Bacteroidales bacterium]
MNKIIFTAIISIFNFSVVISQNIYNNSSAPPYVEDVFEVYSPTNYLFPSIYDIISDKDGDIYICGDAGYMPLLGDSTISTDKSFWAKFNPDGNLLMNIDILGVNASDYGIGGICVDRYKNVYGILRTSYGLIFNGNTYWSANGDNFIAKWDSLGDELWIKQIDTYVITDIVVNENGTDVICSGNFTISMQIDSVQYFYCGNNAIMDDVFIASFNASSGNTKWVEIIGNEGDETIYCLEIDEAGNVYAPIQFYGDSTQIGNYTVTRTNTYEPMATVLCKINPTGMVDWTLLFDGKLNIHHTDFVNEHFYFTCLMNTDTLKIDTMKHINPSTRAGLYGKIDTTGSLQWLSTIDTDIWNVVDFGLSTNDEGETLVYGTKDTGATFTHNSQILDSSNNNIFYVKFDDNGNLQWYKSYLSTAHPGYLLGITWGKQNDFYSTFNVIHQNAEITIGNFTLTDSLGQYAFIPKMLDYSQQKVPLPAGWGMISSYIEPYEDSLVSVLYPVVNHLVILKNNAGYVYWPQFGVNTIVNWQYHQGYQIKMALADSLFMLGGKIQPDTALLQISMGWNIIPYFNFQPIVADSIFSNYTSNVVIVKDGSGQVYWPQYTLNNIGQMQPGKGYQVKAYQSFNFYYPPE